MSGTRTVTVLGINEVTRVLGVHRDTLRSWRNAGSFPTPDLVLSGAPGWLPATVRRWQRAQERTAA